MRTVYESMTTTAMRLRLSPIWKRQLIFGRIVRSA